MRSWCSRARLEARYEHFRHTHSSGLRFLMHGHLYTEDSYHMSTDQDERDHHSCDIVCYHSRRMLEVSALPLAKLPPSDLDTGPALADELAVLVNGLFARLISQATGEVGSAKHRELASRRRLLRSPVFASRPRSTRTISWLSTPPMPVIGNLELVTRNS